LVEIGDPLSIEAIQAANDINWKMPFSTKTGSIAKKKQEAVDYLIRQSKSKKYIKPPTIYNNGNITDL